MITANDVVISMVALPVGLSYWSKRQPGLIFGNKYGCGTLVYIWHITISLSILLVMCLSITRTFSLVRPFKKQKVSCLIIAVVTNTVLTLVQPVVLQILCDMKIKFLPEFSRCLMEPPVKPDRPNLLLTMGLIGNMQYIAPAFVVATSCVISAVLLTRGNKLVQQREQQQSRNRATVTILLFALLYGVCNIPLVVDFIVIVYCQHTENMKWYEKELYKFDTQDYYVTFMRTILLVINSAANPTLYFWRMPPLRDFTLASIRRIQQQNSGIRRTQNSVQSRDPAVN